MCRMIGSFFSQIQSILTYQRIYHHRRRREDLIQITFLNTAPLPLFPLFFSSDPSNSFSCLTSIYPSFILLTHIHVFCSSHHPCNHHLFFFFPLASSSSPYTHFSLPIFYFIRINLTPMLQFYYLIPTSLITFLDTIVVGIHAPLHRNPTLFL